MKRWAGLFVLGILAACGPDQGPVAWVDARAAVVRCTSAGRDRMPPVLLDLPAPALPTGMYARGLDPMALDELGFQRDTIACGILTPADSQTVREDAASISALLEARVAAGRAALRASGPCACDAANRAGLRGLIPQCLEQPTQPGCDPERAREEVTRALQPALDAVESARPPLVHWRLVGTTDRPGWFAERQTALAATHEGGSTIYVRGQAVPLRGNGPLLRALLLEDDVVAVAHQDSGRALLVVRESGAKLILDHFEYPVVGPKTLPLLPFIDNANVERYRELLRKPGQTRPLSMDPKKGNMVEVDVRRLREVDAIIDVSGLLAGGAGARRGELPESRVDVVAAQAPFGKKGAVLQVLLTLSQRGRDWAGVLSQTPLSSTLDELRGPGGPDQSDDEGAVSLPPTNNGFPYLLAGTALEASVVYGLEQVPDLMAAVEMRYPASVEGTARAWSFAMPPSDLSGLLGEGARFTGVRRAFEQNAYEVEVTISDLSDQIRAEIAPR